MPKTIGTPYGAKTISATLESPIFAAKTMISETMIDSLRSLPRVSWSLFTHCSRRRIPLRLASLMYNYKRQGSGMLRIGLWIPC